MQEKGNAEFQFSVLYICRTRTTIDQLLWQISATLDLSFSAISEAEKSDRLLWGRKLSILLISVLGGGRNQLSSERFLTFLRTEITWICVLPGIVLPPSTCPAAKYPIPTPKYHTYLRRAVPTANGACAGEMASPFHMKAIAAVAAAAAHQHHCCCCCVQPQSQHQQQHYRSSSSSSIAADNMSACSIHPNQCEYRTRYAYCTSKCALFI